MSRRPARLSTHDLKERGWTPAMIRDLLGPHDATRPSEMRVGSRNRVVDAEVKLYDEERVRQAESTERFARHQDAARARQDAAEKSAQTRRQRTKEQIDAYVAAYPADITPPNDMEQLSGHDPWKYHLRQLEQWEWSDEAEAMLRGLKAHARTEARSRVYMKHRAAYRVAYGLEVEA